MVHTKGPRTMEGHGETLQEGVRAGWFAAVAGTSSRTAAVRRSASGPARATASAMSAFASPGQHHRPLVPCTLGSAASAVVGEAPAAGRQASGAHVRASQTNRIAPFPYHGRVCARGWLPGRVVYAMMRGGRCNLMAE